MAIAKRVKWYLDTHHVDYELISHKHTMSSLESAQAAHVPEGLVAKSVLLEDERGYVLAVIPASCRLQLEEIEDQTGRRLELATEGELLSLFRGCELGAIPPLGEAFNIPTAVDDSLLRLPEVYFEAGDHEELVHISGPDFRAISSRAQHGRFCHPH